MSEQIRTRSVRARTSEVSDANNVVLGDGADRAVLTIAVGKPYYTELAINLARSFVQWHPASKISFYLVTNHPEMVPPDLHTVRVVAADPGLHNKGFGTKLQIDRLAPAKHTLFIDADCLCFGPLDAVFDRFNGHAVSVVGAPITDGQFSGDVAALCRTFNVPALIEFIGGIYYVEKGATASAVFDTARALEARYDELGLVRLRGLPNEEPLLSIAMAVHRQTPIADDGAIKGDALCYPTGISADVVSGVAVMRNDPAHPKYRPASPLTEAHPQIVHFNCSFADQDPYLREVKRLRLIRAHAWPVFLASAYAWVTTSLPLKVAMLVKDVLRPLYHRLFGPRPVAASPRM